MTDQAPTPPPVDAPPTVAPAAPPLAVVPSPDIQGSPVDAQAGTPNNEWADAIKNAAPMALPEIIADGGRIAGRVARSPGIEIEVQTRDPEPEPLAPVEDAEPTEAEQAGEESFVARAEAERERLYQRRTADVRQRQFEQMQSENQQVRAEQQSMLTAEQVGEQLRKDPFGFMREHGVGLQDLNKELDAGRANSADPGVSKEVFQLQQQVQATNAQLQQLREQNFAVERQRDKSEALSTLQQGLTQYKESYPGLHALFGAQGSTTSPAEQVLIGLERAQAAGRPMSANEVAGRLENEARVHFDRLASAYKPPTAPAQQQTQQPPQVAHHTAGITNQTSAPVRRPRAISRQEEINQAAQLIRFVS